MLLNQDQLDEFHLRGFVVSPVPVLGEAEVDELLAELQLVVESKSAKKPVLNRNLVDGTTEYGEAQQTAKEVWQVVNIWEASEKFFELARNREITGTVARMCGNTPILRIWHDQIVAKPATRGGRVGWHQDFLAWPIIEPGDLVGAWVALDDVEIENGCMWMVPGSHRWGAVRPRTGDALEPLYDEALLPEGVEVRPVPVQVKRGHVAFHHCMTWHASPENESERHRRAIAIHYMPGYTIFMPRGRSHAVGKHVTVKPGEILEGDGFPVVYENKRNLEENLARYTTEPA